MSMKKDKVLFIVDPQNDFVDPRGNLYVPYSEYALDEILHLIYQGNWDRIIVTQDTHQEYHIGHPGFWEGGIKPFAQITKSDIVSGKFIPVHYTDSELEKIKESVICEMEKSGVDYITVWPIHCLVGTWGHSFPKSLSRALNYWAIKNHKAFEVYSKGTNPYKESYSLLDDVTPNLENIEKIQLCGFCRDICVLNTYRALLACDENVLSLDTEIEVLTSATSSVNSSAEAVDKMYEEVAKLFPNRVRFEKR